MLDLTTTRGKIIDAALRLAAKDGWSGLALDRIAREAGVSLADFRREFSSKSEILAAFSRAVDDATLAKLDPADAETAPRDRLFDVLMTRFEVMEPYKAGIRHIRHDAGFSPGSSLVQLGVAARSLYWMLAAAGIDAEGTRGAIRLPGLMSIYGRTFQTWLDDDDAGLARTMAALDGRLRSGEKTMRRIDDATSAAKRFCTGLMNKGGRRKNAASAEPVTQPPVESAPEDLVSPQTNGNGNQGPAPAI